jgi:hypothetical protein
VERHRVSLDDLEHQLDISGLSVDLADIGSEECDGPRDWSCVIGLEV